MTAQKKLLSAICIISLILAITAGVLLSVGADSIDNAYIGDDVRLSSTGVTVDAQSSVPKPVKLSDDVAKISSSEDLMAFLEGTGKYEGVNDGYISETVKEIELDWDGVGSTVAFTNGRTLDGNGCTITLLDKEATAIVSNPTGDDNSYTNGSGGEVRAITTSGFSDPLGGVTTTRNYGMFVAYNSGTIKNIKFEYKGSASVVDNGNNNDLGTYYVGIVCGSNSGRIENCDLIVGGEDGNSRAKFGFYYCRGSANKTSNVDYFQTRFGGFAGRNGGAITNVTATYDNFDCNINTRGLNTGYTSVVVTKIQYGAAAYTFVGGIAGSMYGTKSECSNIIVTATEYVRYSLIAQRDNDGVSKSDVYRILAAVVPANSDWIKAEGGIGKTSDTQAKVDNIIADFSEIDYDYTSMRTGNDNALSDASRNAVVVCGKATNVTVLKKTDGAFDNQTDHCGCGVDGNPGEHETGFSNLISVDDYSNVTVGFDENKNQVITVTPKDNNAILGAVKFGKFLNNRKDEGGNVVSSVEESDTESAVTEKYPCVPANDSDYVQIYNDAQKRNEFKLTVSPYQQKSNYYWKFDAYCYQLATFVDEISPEYTYNGKDVLKEKLTYTLKSGGAPIPVELKYAGYEFTKDGEPNTAAVLPGKYNLKLREKEDGLFYVDKDNRVAVLSEGKEELEYSFTINKATMQIVEENYEALGNKWFNYAPTFTFALTGNDNTSDAVDGYYVNSNRVRSLEITHDIADTAGETFTVYLTKGNVQVTVPIEYTIKMDRTKPEAELSYEDNTEGIWYDHNIVAISATDTTSGLASIKVGDTDIKALCEEGAGNGYVQDGVYYWYIDATTPAGPIVITDVAGNSISRDIAVKINPTPEPTVEVTKVYYNKDGDKVDYDNEEYDSENPIHTKVYVNFNFDFGVSDGKLMYKYNDEEVWSEFDKSKDFVVTRSGEISFKAVSNTFYHDEANNYFAYEKECRTIVTVNIELESVVIPEGSLIIKRNGNVIGSEDTIEKTFDGKDTCDVVITIDEGYLEQFGSDVTFTLNVKYSDVNAGENIPLIVEVNCSDETKHVTLDPDFALFGNINKKAITVTISDADKNWGEDMPEFKYQVADGDWIDGFEDEIELYVIIPDGYTEKTLAGGVYDIYAKNELLNYDIVNAPTATLTVHRLKIERLEYPNGTFTGIDTDNIKTREFVVFFKGFYDDYGAVTVKLCGVNGDEIDMDTVSAGIYDVVLSIDGKLGEIYELIEDLASFKIRVIDASIFDVKEEQKPVEPEPAETPDDKDTEDDKVADADNNDAKQDAPVVMDNANAQVGTYEDGNANTDSTDMVIEPSQKSKDYLAMISIFCAVAVATAFAIGVGRAIKKRIRH